MESTVKPEGKHDDPHKHHIKGDLNHDGCVNMTPWSCSRKPSGSKGRPGFNPEADFIATAS